jgi:hypothetical protein
MTSRTSRFDRVQSERRATIAALQAIATIGGKFHEALDLGFGPMGTDSLAYHVSDWNTSIWGAVASNYKYACEINAFAIERVDGSGNMRGYRLIRYNEKGGHTYSGETFATAEAFADAMRTVEDLATHPACKVQGRGSYPTSLVIIGRCARVSGNTYHTAEIFIDGSFYAKTPIAYGYDLQYLDTAHDLLIENGKLPPRKIYQSGAKESLRNACERVTCILTHSHADVKGKASL